MIKMLHACMQIFTSFLLPFMHNVICMYIHTFNSCNMGTSGLLDIYT